MLMLKRVVQGLGGMVLLLVMLMRMMGLLGSFIIVIDLLINVYFRLI